MEKGELSPHMTASEADKDEVICCFVVPEQRPPADVDLWPEADT